jgi:hypothetical protein
VRFRFLLEVTIQVNVLCEVIPCDHLTTLMMEAAGLSETLLHVYQSKRHCQPRDMILH